MSTTHILRDTTKSMAHALILGASGISGWSIMNQITTYPTPTTFARITGTTNRPLTLERARLSPDPRVQLVSGVDFTRTVDEVAALLREKVADVDTVSHVFYTAYIQTDDPDSLKVVNTKLLEVAVRAVEAVSCKLEVVILQTGGKGYGMQFPDKVSIRPPLREDLPRIPQPWADSIFYYAQYDLLEALSRGKAWTFTEIRPDGIVGYCPTANPMNLAEGVGVYLSMYRQVHGAGAGVPFPGGERAWRCRHSDTSQDVLARVEIYAALNKGVCGGGRAFNVADGEVVTWAGVWPGLCAHFGLVSEPPRHHATTSGSTPTTGGGDKRNSMGEFVKAHAEVWRQLARDHDGLDPDLADRHNWAFTDFMLGEYDFDREYDLGRARAAGFGETADTVGGYVLAWERMRDGGVLPRLG